MPTRDVRRRGWDIAGKVAIAVGMYCLAAYFFALDESIAGFGQILATTWIVSKKEYWRRSKEDADTNTSNDDT